MPTRRVAKKRTTVVKRKGTTRKRRSTHFHKWAKSRAQPWMQGRGIFGDMWKGLKTAFTDPQKIVKGLTHLNSGKNAKDFNPVTGKYGMFGAWKTWFDKKDPMHKKMRAYAKPVFNVFDQIAKADPTGVASKVISTVQAGEGRKRRVVRRRRKAVTKR